MDKIHDNNYELINYDSSYGSTRLEIKIGGKNIDYIIVNTLRRIIFTSIPIYAFTEFNIKKNTSIFNNNYMKLRLKNFPIWGIENNLTIYNPIKKIDTIDEEDVDNAEYEINDFADINEDSKVNTSSLKQLTMYLDYTSKSSEIVTVTTDDANFYYAGNTIENPYKIPIPLIKLHPKQIINLSVITTIGIEKESAIFSPVSVCFYKQINDEEFDFIIESKGQLTEKRIIEVAIINILDKLKSVPKMIPLEQSSHFGEIIFFNEDNTLGNLLSSGLQKHKHIKFAGYNIPHLLENKVIIHYELINEKILLKTVINDVVEYYIEIFTILLNKNKKLKLKK